MRVIVLDLDGTLTIDEPGRPYAERRPRLDVIEKVRELHGQGFRIVVSTARNMNTHGGNVGIINHRTLPTIIEWLKEHDVPFDEIHVGKPWCGFQGFYVDDKAIRPDEFVSLDLPSIQRLVGVAPQS